ncbi:protein GrpE [Elysia marginata]|uniref:Protein GrpE n=1 Tax=Elysia marginata TaxID=1093978 RepID=A0AAV4FS68_9GAST|nr:protein GrpE [Elysia marginata]
MSGNKSVSKSKPENLKYKKTSSKTKKPNPSVAKPKKPSPSASGEKNEIHNLKEDLKAEKDKFIRLFAEFENYKKRTSKEHIDLIDSAGKDVILSFLPILDDFERAMQQMKGGENNTLFQGVELIYNKFFETLKIKGLKVIEVEKESEFDSEIHEAISQVPSPNEKMKGKIIDVVEKGYKVGEKTIRYPKVVIAN